jgi:tetratricopeptide (TPR) repeat protein
MATPLQRAILLHQRGDLRQAEEIYRGILRVKPDEPDALHLLGCIELSKGERERAIELITRAIRIRPGVALYHENLASAFHRARDPERARAECARAMALDPKRPQARTLLGLIAIEAGRPDEAITILQAVLEEAPDHRDAMVNLAIAWNRTGVHEKGAELCMRALRLAPADPRAWTNLGMSYKGMRRLVEAKRAFERAGEFPMARFNLGYTYLLENDLAAGLPLCEARKTLTRPGRGLTQPEWDGRPAPGRRLVVAHEQGLGDAILMSRFFVPLIEAFSEVSVVVPGPLKRLFATIDPRLRWIERAEEASADLWCATMSLPWLLGIDAVEKIPLVPWFRLPPARTREGGATERAVAAGLPVRAGINWAGNPSFAYDHTRSAHLSDLEALLSIPGIEWVSLHKGHRENEAKDAGLAQPLEAATDFLDTAEVLQGLDLVVSTETAVPNLSGAMGIPTCVLAARDYDWRWGAWYADVTVCAQHRPGDWSAAVEAASAWVRSRASRAA